MSNEIIPLPGAKPRPQLNPLVQKIVERLESYLKGQLISDAQQREIVAAYLSGMVSALDMVSLKKGRNEIILPAVLERQIMDFAKGLGMQFEKRE